VVLDRGGSDEAGRMPMARIAELRVGGKVTLASRPIVRRLRVRALPLVEGSQAPERARMLLPPQRESPEN
jgi:hypothetical protein